MLSLACLCAAAAQSSPPAEELPRGTAPSSTNPSVPRRELADLCSEVTRRQDARELEPKYYCKQLELDAAWVLAAGGCAAFYVQTSSGFRLCNGDDSDKPGFCGQSELFDCVWPPPPPSPPPPAPSPPVSAPAQMRRRQNSCETTYMSLFE